MFAAPGSATLHAVQATSMLRSFAGDAGEGATEDEVRDAVGQLRALLEGVSAAHDWQTDGFTRSDLMSFLTCLESLDALEEHGARPVPLAGVLVEPEQPQVVLAGGA